MGLKVKENQDGETVSQAERRDVRTMYKQQADLLWQDCVSYLERNATLFPEYRCNSGCGDNNRINKPRMRMKLI